MRSASAHIKRHLFQEQMAEVNSTGFHFEFGYGNHSTILQVIRDVK
jgi:hypothetical protein